MPRQVTVSRGVLLVCVLALLGCGSPNHPSSTPVPIGMWGGPEVALEVTATGAFMPDPSSCFDASIGQPLLMDRSGRFTVDGTWVVYPLGSRPGIPFPAHFSGVVSGTKMTLTVTFAGHSQVYLLNYGSPPIPPFPMC